MEEKQITILAIDDSETTLDLLEMFVLENFPEVRFLRALNGETGLQMAGSENPDVILLDILMPGINGYTVCKKLKQDEVLKDIPVVFITVLVETSEKIKALEVGAEGFLNKPVDEVELTAQIRAMLKIRAANLKSLDEKQRLQEAVDIRTRELEKQLDESRRLELRLRENEAKLRLSEEKFSKAFHSSPNISGLSDIDDEVFVEVNQTFLDNLEYSLEEVIGKKPGNLVRMNDQFRTDTLNKLKEFGSVRNLETTIYSKTGRPLEVLLSADIIQIGNKKYNFTTAVVITDLKKAEKKIKHYSGLLELLMKVAMNYINLPINQIDSGLYEALKTVGQGVAVDRAYLFNYDLINRTTTCTHEWCKDGIEPQIHHFQKKPIDDLGDYTYHSSGQTFYVPDTRKVEDDEIRAFLQLMDIKSIITIPLIIENECFGYIGFDAVNNYRNFDDHDLVIFNFFAQLIINLRLREHDQNSLIISNERFRLIFNHAPLLIDAFDQNGRCLLWNRHCESVFGWSADEIKAHPDHISLFYPDPAICHAVKQSVTLFPLKQPVTWHPYAKDGRQLITDWINFKLPDGMVINIGFDLTQQKMTEKLLSESEHRYFDLFNNLQEGFFVCEIICDKDGEPVDYRHIDINKAFETQTGLKVDNCIGKTVKEILPDVEPFWIKNYGQVGLSGKPLKFEGYNKSTGKIYEVSAFSPAKNQTAAVFIDITERKQNERFLKLALERFNLVAEKSNTVYWEIDGNGLYTYLSKSVSKVFGYLPEELIGKEYFFNLHPNNGREDFQIKVIDMIKTKTEISGLEHQVVKKKNEIIWVSTYGLPLLNDHGEVIGYRGSDIDVDKAKMYEKQLKSTITEIEKYRLKLSLLNAALLEAEESERKKIAGFLHDGLGQLLSVSRIKLTSLLTSEKAEKEINSTIEDVSGILNSAILQCRELTYDLNPPILKQYGLVNALKSKAEQITKEVPIEVFLESFSDNLMIEYDRSIILYRIICELLNNAVKHAKCRRIVVRIEKPEPKLRISVIDDGVGFSYSNDMKNIRKHSFGLFSITERLSAMNGQLIIEAEPGKGAKAIIEI
jgi:PAS domain S-box-containing protein